MATTTGPTKNYMPRINELIYVVHGFDYVIGIIFFLTGLYSMFTERESLNGLVLTLVGVVCLWAGTSSKTRVTFWINLLLGILCLIGFTSRALSYDGIGPELELPFKLNNDVLYGGLCFLFLLNAFFWWLAYQKRHHLKR